VIPYQCLEIALDLLINKPFLEGGHTEEIWCDKLMTDMIEEVVPPCVVEFAST
jgi:hypothetical protein